MSIEYPGHIPYGSTDTGEPLVDPASVQAETEQVSVEPSFGVYRPSDEIEYGLLHRGFSDFTHHMRMVYPEAQTLDTLLANQLDRARKIGRNVVVLDLGAGTGEFSRQFLDNPEAGEKTRRRLAGKLVDSNLHFYSVTDAQAAEDHLRATPFPESDNDGNEQISAQEVQYSITSSQSVKKLLEGIGEQSADLVVASSFLQYLRPPVFERVVQDVVDVLEPGGAFVAFGYATLAGKHLNIDDGYAEADGLVMFADPTNQDMPGVSSDVLRARGEALLADPQTTDEQLIAAIDNLQSFMFSSEFYSQPVLQDFRGGIRKSISEALQEGETPRELLSRLLETVYPLAEASQRIQDIKQVKDDILEALAEKNKHTASIKHKRIPDQAQGMDAILVRKRLAGHKMAKAIGRSAR